MTWESPEDELFYIKKKHVCVCVCVCDICISFIKLIVSGLSLLLGLNCGLLRDFIVLFL